MIPFYGVTTGRSSATSRDRGSAASARTHRREAAVRRRTRRLRGRVADVPRPRRRATRARGARNARQPRARRRGPRVRRATPRGRVARPSFTSSCTARRTRSTSSTRSARCRRSSASTRSSAGFGLGATPSAAPAATRRRPHPYRCGRCAGDRSDTHGAYGAMTKPASAEQHRVVVHAPAREVAPRLVAVGAKRHARRFELGAQVVELRADRR